MLYLDHAATTPLRPEARAAMAPFLDDAFGNPSGIHAVSRRAKNAVEEARELVADLLGAAHPLDVVFTGGGTESINLAVKGPLLAAGPGSRLVTTAVEHEAVLGSGAALERLGFGVTVVPVDGLGRVDPGDVALAVDDATRVVSVMTANNETGVVQPVAKVAAAVRTVSARVLVHTDAVQAVPSTLLDRDEMGVDLVSVSAHKFGGPKGVGALVMHTDVDVEPVIHGGGQELGRRSGTHDVAGIVGMAAALAAAAADRERFVHAVGGERAAFEARLLERVPDALVTASAADRLVQHSHVRFPGVDVEGLLVRLDAAGVAASSGSACHSGARVVSHVLRAMGIPDEAARECARFTFGWTSAAGDGVAAAERVAGCVESLR